MTWAKIAQTMACDDPKTDPKMANYFGFSRLFFNILSNFQFFGLSAYNAQEQLAQAEQSEDPEEYEEPEEAEQHES